MKKYGYHKEAGIVDGEIIVPMDRFRPVVEAWLARFEEEEEAFLQLETDSPYSASAWRKRLAGNVGWLQLIRIDGVYVDEFLTAAGLTELWRTEFADLLPEPRMSAEEFDQTCASCGCWIDWSRPDKGVRLELKKAKKWPQWWSLCSLCYARKFGCPTKSDCAGRTTRRIPEQVLLDLYESYIRHEIGIGKLAENVYARYGFPTARGCAVSIENAWKKAGFPLRGRVLSKRLNGKHRHRKLGTRIPEADLRRMHLLHEKRFVSIWRLARANYERFGYSNPKSMTSAISQGWRLLDLQAHDRIEMTVRASTIDGLSPRDRKARAQLRKAAGLTVHKGKPRRPLCVERGCKEQAMNTGEWCHYHDPARVEESTARLAAMRANSPKHRDRVSLGEIGQELETWFEANGRRWGPLVEATGWSNTMLRRIITQEFVMPETRDRLRRGLDEVMALPLAA